MLLLLFLIIRTRLDVTISTRIADGIVLLATHSRSDEFDAEVVTDSVMDFVVNAHSGEPKSLWVSGLFGWIVVPVWGRE